MTSSSSFIIYVVVVYMMCIVGTIGGTNDGMIVKSLVDTSDYHRYALANGMDVMLVHDPDASMASVAVDVNAGWWNESVPGLAHFVEHMLFLGTAKYPHEGAFSRFTGRYGGHSNAFTGASHTNFYFTIEDSGLEEGLSRFSQFFVAPLFSESGVARELKAVHAEFIKDLNDDDTRVEQVIQTLMDPKFPAHHFSVGSLETLGNFSSANLREQVARFWNEHYTAPNMRLTVLTGHDRNKVKAWISSTFGSAPAQRDSAHKATSMIGTPIPTVYTDNSRHIFPRDTLGSMLYVQSESNVGVLTLSWPIPPQTPHYADKRLKYVVELLQNHHRRSLASRLRRFGLITEMKVSRSFNTVAFDILDVEFRLLKDALTYDDVRLMIGLTMEYLRLIETEGVDEWRWREQGWTQAFKFKYPSAPEGTSYVSRISYSMGIFKPKDILQADFMYETFDAQGIRDVLARLVPHNMIVTLRRHQHWPHITCDRVEHYYGTKYHVQQLPDSELEHFRLLRTAGEEQVATELELPSHNPYLVSAHDLILRNAAPSMKNFAGDRSFKVPYLLRNDPGMRVWYQHSTARNEPHVYVKCVLWTRAIYESPRTRVMATLYSHLVQHRWHSTEYLATMAGASMSMTAHPDGLMLEIDGYGFDSSFMLLLNDIHNHLELPAVLDRHFSVVALSLRNSYHEMAFSSISSHIESSLEMLLKTPHFHTSEYLRALETITLNDVLEWRRSAFNDMLAEVMVVGNANEKEALDMTTALLHDFTFASQTQSWASSPHVMRVVSISGNHVFSAPSAARHEQNSATLVYMQAPNRRGGAAYRRMGAIGHGIVGGDGTYTREAQLIMVNLIEILMEKPLYHQLRTKQQLGYVVDGGSVSLSNIVGLYATVVSPKYPATELHNRIMEFFRVYLRNVVHHLGDDEFKQLVESVAPASDGDNGGVNRTQQLSKDNCSMSDVADGFWSDIVDRTYDFIEPNVTSNVSISEQLNKADFMQFYDDMIDAHRGTSNVSGVLSVQIQGRGGQVPPPDEPRDFLTRFYGEQFDDGHVAAPPATTTQQRQYSSVSDGTAAIPQTTEARVHPQPPQSLSPHQVRVQSASSPSSLPKRPQPQAQPRAANAPVSAASSELFGRRMSLSQHSGVDMRIDADPRIASIDREGYGTTRERMESHHVGHLFSGWDRRKAHNALMFEDGPLTHLHSSPSLYVESMLGLKPRKSSPKPKPGPGEELVKLKESHRRQELQRLMPETPKTKRVVLKHRSGNAPPPSPPPQQPRAQVNGNGIVRWVRHEIEGALSHTPSKGRTPAFLESLARLSNNNNKNNTVAAVKDSRVDYYLPLPKLAATCNTPSTNPPRTDVQMTLTLVNEFKSKSCIFEQEAVNVHPLDKSGLEKIISEHV